MDSALSPFVTYFFTRLPCAGWDDDFLASLITR